LMMTPLSDEATTTYSTYPHIQHRRSGPLPD